AEAATDGKTIKRLWRMKGKSGAASYRGRIGIYEVLPVTPEIQKLIISGASSEAIQDEAIKEGMVTMQTDGLIKALQGQTTLEEIMRVTSEH
ncbi:MAG TPA: type II/IV secretion system protein, partial [Candidatus Saccharimonadales bacterium]|nr:type II/IV secretion system protein [Candidatus Saccharimonadales bacterium]